MVEAGSYCQEGGHSVRVLLIDDDPTVRDDLEFLLPATIRIVWAPGSEEAMEKIGQERHLDAIILDLCLPPHLSEREESEGLELLSALCEELAPQVPVVVLSSVPRCEAEAACLKRGASAYLEKPCSPGELLRLLRGLTEHPSAQ